MKHFCEKYFDYAATTPCDEKILQKMAPYWNEHFGNASSRSHKYGWKAEEAVENAFSFAKEGTTILLSPGGTSYDWYKDYKQRGNDFKDKVKSFVLENSNE